MIAPTNDWRNVEQSQFASKHSINTLISTSNCLMTYDVQPASFSFKLWSLNFNKSAPRWFSMRKMYFPISSFWESRFWIWEFEATSTLHFANTRACSTAGHYRTAVMGHRLERSYTNLKPVLAAINVLETDFDVLDSRSARFGDVNFQLEWARAGGPRSSNFQTICTDEMC